MTLPRYFFQHGSFYFGESLDNIRFMADAITILYDEESGTIIKHGAPDRIDAYMAGNNMRKFMEIYPVIRRVTFHPSEEAADWINTTISISGSMLVRLKALLEISTPAEKSPGDHS